MENADIIDISHQIDAIIQAPYRCGVPRPMALCQDKRVRYNTNWSFNFLRICCKPIYVKFYDTFPDISQTGRI